jgi:hypothetical protein
MLLAIWFYRWIFSGHVAHISYPDWYHNSIVDLLLCGLIWELYFLQHEHHDADNQHWPAGIHDCAHQVSCVC